jgi:transposase
MVYCKGCIEKDLKIEKLKETIKSLQAKLNYRQRKEAEGFFGASTPSSKVPFKENASEEKKNSRGGGVFGHRGHGRLTHTEESADHVLHQDVGDTCPACHSPLTLKEVRNRTVIESTPTKPERILYRLAVKECKSCHRIFRAKAPSVLPKSLYGNQITAQLAVMHYFHGITMGRITEMTGISLGTVIDIFHRLGRYFGPLMEALKETYRQDVVKHADETSWRNDGQNGYAWLFCTAVVSIFLFKNTRSSSVPKGIFGEKNLPGVLVVDRYSGYNKAPLKIQYCYAHLMRDVEELAKGCPDNEEVVRFTGTLIPLLAAAMHLASQDISDKDYYRMAKKLQKKIIAVSRSPAHHLGIRAVQDIVTDHEDRLFHWVVDRHVPADNNRAERELRPTVIARKVSFGSSSDAGAETRSVLMSVLHTLNKRRGKQSLESVFKEILDEIARNTEVDLIPLVLRPLPDPP